MLTHTMPRSGRTLLSAVFSASRSEFMSAVIHQQKTQGQHGLRDSAALEVSSREGTRSSHVDSVVSTLVHPLGPVVMTRHRTHRDWRSQGQRCRSRLWVLAMAVLVRAAPQWPRQLSSWGWPKEGGPSVW